MAAQRDPGFRMKTIDGFHIGFGHEPRAPWACDPSAGASRLFPETASPTRTAFQRDRDRIVHSNAFRRLKHKTQVFLESEADHHRTRLTHTIEVAQIARGLARAFRLDEDLTEAIALAHDFGHTPFGHAGERALDRAMANFGGFDHNLQTLRTVMLLEQGYADHDGLNLTAETIEGLAKHNGALVGPTVGGDEAVPPFLARAAAQLRLRLDRQAPLEAQCAAIADDIAYDTHDIDDGLRSGILTLQTLAQAPLVGRIIAEVRAAHPGIADDRLAHELTRRQITFLVEDVIKTGARMLVEAAPRSPDDVRQAGQAMIAFSEATATEEAGLKRFLSAALYRNPRVINTMHAAEQVVEDLFSAYRRDPDILPPGRRLENGDPLERRIADYVAGMTDRFALREHRRLFDHTPDIG
jgi:dGTPase